MKVHRPAETVDEVQEEVRAEGAGVGEARLAGFVDGRVLPTR